ncbi:universal stress protein [Solwaraspora sp. WMMA2056]|uniref:universal stress protein n=1 Tax=Solwaraspora sp. WMMA2056 TaxID=3015161 RepID=UPI00259B2724|nr:universal stress protein [Solwaraspora sp. WMMA2056]WJK44090.1 universal stress protein [Solwaraspora sp. WMMA2056]
MDPRRITVGLDRSPAARAALAWAVRRAGRCGATVLVVTAWPDVDRAVARSDGTLPAGQVRLHRMQRDAIATALAGLDTTPLVVREIIYAAPDAALAHAAAGADLLVIGGDQGTPGRLADALRRRLDGTRVVRGSAAQLVVVRAPDVARTTTARPFTPARPTTPGTPNRPTAPPRPTALGAAA